MYAVIDDIWSLGCVIVSRTRRASRLLRSTFSRWNFSRSNVVALKKIGKGYFAKRSVIERRSRECFVGRNDFLSGVSGKTCGVS